MTRATGLPLRLFRLLLPALLCATVLSPLVVAAPAQAAVPSRKHWVADVVKAMHGSQRYVDRRAAEGGTKLAVNFDIDNTALASHYDYGTAIGVVLRFARNAGENHVSILFNTGRVVGDGRLKRARRQLVEAGFQVTEMCGRKSAKEGLAHSKKRCRRHFVKQGYTIIANVGNRATDFAGGNYERAYRLPNYDNQLA